MVLEDLFDEFDSKAIRLALAIVQTVEAHGFEFVLDRTTARCFAKPTNFREARLRKLSKWKPREEDKEPLALICAGIKAGGPKLELVNGDKRASFSFALREKGKPLPPTADAGPDTYCYP